MSSGRGRGRGAYYKEKYGRGGGGGGGGGRRRDDDGGGGRWGTETAPDTAAAGPPARGPRTSQQLRDTLRRIHHSSYPAYKELRGAWEFPGAFTLHVDHVQGDAYAAPSRCHLVVPAEVAGLPPDLYSTPTRRVALCDLLARAFGAAVAASGGDVRAASGGWGGQKGGEMGVDTPSQHVLERTAVLIRPDGAVEARFTVGLPAQGRSVLGDWAAAVLVTNLPRYAAAGLHYASLDPGAVARHVACVEDTEALRAALPPLGLVAFVGDGAVLPRASGASDAPMAGAGVVPFRSPASLAVEVALPNRGVVRGMGLRAGVTLICGGGFHGKSTLLEALEAGVYNKVPGDGRELVATDPGAVKIRAEDGRRVSEVDISPYIANLPQGRPTRCFSTLDASGSTSQAANIQEALEAGATALLIDEDTSATNFMIRDARMRELVAGDKEPITPFVARVRALAAAGVSCVLVVGGTGEYFSAADCVVTMDCYRPEDATRRAHTIAARHPALEFDGVEAAPYPPIVPRTLVAIEPSSSSSSAGGGDGVAPRLRTRALHTVQVEGEELDLSGVEQLVEVSQTRAVAEALLLMRRRLGEGGGGWRGLPLAEVLRRLEAEVDAQGLDALVPGGARPGNLARPRRLEIAAAVNRLRCAELQQLPPPAAPAQKRAR